MKKNTETGIKVFGQVSKQIHSTDSIIRDDIDDLTEEDIGKLERFLKDEKKSIAVSTMNKLVYCGKAKIVPYAGKPDAFREVGHKVYRLLNRNGEGDRWYPLPDNFFKYK